MRSSIPVATAFLLVTSPCAAAAAQASLAGGAEPAHSRPCRHTEPSGSSRSRGSSRSAGRGALSVLGALLDVASAVASSSESASPSSGEESDSSGPPLTWPGEIGLHLAGTYGSADWTDTPFADDQEGVRWLGSALSLGHVPLVGADLVAELKPWRNLRIALGFGIYAPASDAASPNAAFGRGATASGPLFFSGYGEVGVVLPGRMLDPFLMARAGVTMASVDVRTDCGCTYHLLAMRGTAGPRAGLRAYLYRSLYLEGSFYLDALSFPDYVVAGGLGIGARPS